MENELERLRVMLEKQTGWSNVTHVGPAPIVEPASAATWYFSSDPDDDEKILSFEHRVGGKLEHTIGHDEVHEVSDFPKYNLQFAEEAPEGEIFCSLRELLKYPYNFISLASRAEVAKRFFDKGLFYDRPWDLFYIHAPYSPSTDSRQSIVLIPSSQFQHFLVSINNVLQTHLKLPDLTTHPDLLFEFPKDGTPRPRYLGYTNEREMAEHLKKAIPSSSYKPDDEIEETCEPSEKSLEAFKRKIERLLESDKKKKLLTKEKKKLERFGKQQAWAREIKRVQRYLGLRKADGGPRHVHGATDTRGDKSSSGWGRSTIVESTTRGEVYGPKVVDTENPPPYIQEDSVVFICVDVESYERDHSRITEVGIATLDTTDITMASPGKGGINWMKAIHGRHFRIEETSHLKNQHFITGCADQFQFGESEWISIEKAPQEISSCFKPPYSKPDGPGSKRNIILVGHDIMTDVNYLQKIGYDPYNLSNLQELIDTSSMYRALKRESQPRNLGSILANLDIAGWYLHNAGNDAVYTLQAMISIAVTALQENPDEEAREKESEARIEESVQNAAEAAREAQLGWSSAGSDGGVPVRARPPKGGERRRNPDMP